MLRTHKKLTKKELKKDPLVIFTAQVVDFLRTEWIKIGSIILVVGIVVTLAFIFVGGKRKKAVNAYDTALNALNNDAPEALDLLEKVVEDYDGSRNVPDALIKLGNTYFLQKDYDSSEKFFKRYVDNYSNDPIYAFNAYNGLGGIYEERGEYRKAGEMYEQYISRFNNSAFLPIMYLNAGKVYYHASDKEAARRNFLTILENFKDSREKQEAAFFMELLN